MRILFALLLGLFLLANFTTPAFASETYEDLHFIITVNPDGMAAFQNLYGIAVNPMNNLYWDKLEGITKQSDYPGRITFVNIMVKAHELDAVIQQTAGASAREAFFRVYGAHPATPNQIYVGKLYDFSADDTFDPGAFISSLPSVVILHDALQDDEITLDTKAAFTVIYDISTEGGFSNPYYTGLLFDIVGDDNNYDAIKADNFVGALEDVVALHYALADASEIQRNAFNDIFGVPVNDTLNASKEGLFFRNLPVTGEYTFENPLTELDYTWNDYDARAGDNAWLAMSQLQIYHQKYGPGYNPEETELALAERIARAAIDLIVPDAGIGGMLMKKDSNLISTENVISWYAAFKMLHEITGKAEYLAAMNKMEEFLTYVFDAGSNTFTQSAVKDPDWAPRGVFATDCQTWAIAALGPAKIDAMFGVTGTAYDIWQATKGIAGRYDGGDLVGLTYSTGMTAISIEWTAGGIEAVLKLADYYKTSDPDRSNELLLEAISMRNGIEQYKVDVDADKSAFIYASERTHLPFGWYTPPTDVISTGSTAWISFLTSGFDPFVLGGRIPMFDSLPDLTSIDNLMNWLPTTVDASHGLLSSYQVPTALRNAIIAEIAATNNDDAAAEAAFIFNGFNIYDEALALMSLYASEDPILQALADNITDIFRDGFFGDFSNITDVTDTTSAEMLLYRETLFNVASGSDYKQAVFLEVLPKTISLHNALGTQGLRDEFAAIFGVDVADQDPASNGAYRGKLFGIASGEVYAEADFLMYMPKAALLHEALVDDTLQDLFATVYEVTTIKQLPGNGEYIAALFGIVGTPDYELNEFISGFTIPFPIWYPNGESKWVYPTGNATVLYSGWGLKSIIDPDMIYLELADEDFYGSGIGRFTKEARPDGFTLLFFDYHNGTDVAGRIETYERNSNFLDTTLLNANLLKTQWFDAGGVVEQTQIEPGTGVTYDALGRISSWKFEDVSETFVSYRGDTDVFLKKTYTDLTTGNTIICDYYDNGRAEKVINFAGWYAEYDILGRITKEHISVSETILYTYFEDYIALVEKQVINTADEDITTYSYSPDSSELEGKEVRANPVNPESTWMSLHEALGANVLRDVFEAVYGIPQASQDPLTNFAYRVRLLYITGAAGYDEEDFITVGLPASAGSALIPGDSNLNGRADISDLAKIRSGQGTTEGATWLDGDTNGDGAIDSEDYANFMNRFGTRSPSAGGTDTLLFDENGRLVVRIFADDGHREIYTYTDGLFTGEELEAFGILNLGDEIVDRTGAPAPEALAAPVIQGNQDVISILEIQAQTSAGKKSKSPLKFLNELKGGRKGCKYLDLLEN